MFVEYHEVPICPLRQLVKIPFPALSSACQLLPAIFFTIIFNISLTWTVYYKMQLQRLLYCMYTQCRNYKQSIYELRTVRTLLQLQILFHDSCITNSLTFICQSLRKNKVLQVWVQSFGMWEKYWSSSCMRELLKLRNLKVRSLLKDTLPGLSVGEKEEEGGSSEGGSCHINLSGIPFQFKPLNPATISKC